MIKRNQNKNLTLTNHEIIDSCFVDWSNHSEEQYYYSYSDNKFVIIEHDTSSNNANINNDDESNQPNNNNLTTSAKENILFSEKDEICYKAVTEGVPRNFTLALSDPIWGEAARKEYHTIMVETRAIVECDQDIARIHVKNGAEVLRMLAVYEEKEKEGKLVRKVRLVANGRQHKVHGATYSPTPSREELLIFLHYFAALDCDYYHVDEVRAFLNALKQDQHKTYAKYSGDSTFYEIIGALYGMKTASRDYQDLVATRMEQFGFSRLHMCSCIYIKHDTQLKTFILIYDYVDDFVIGGNNKAYIPKHLFKNLENK
jgi:hypothetical protein